jgi:hypothetical protein
MEFKNLYCFDELKPTESPASPGIDFLVLTGLSSTLGDLEITLSSSFTSEILVTKTKELLVNIDKRILREFHALS